MLYDCFLYSGEEIIDLRFKILGKKVTKFLIFEFDKTFQGKRKKFLFNKSKYNSIKNKLVYIKTKIPENLNLRDPWKMEFFQRDFMLNYLKNLNDNFHIILSDVDEIIDPNKIKFKEKDIFLYQCLNFRFYGNYINVTNPFWILPLSTTVKVAKKIGIQNLRNSYKTLKTGKLYDNYRKKIKFTKVNLVKNAGWHFSSLKESRKDLINIIIDKHKKYAHTEFNSNFFNNRKILSFKIKNGFDIYNEPFFWSPINIKKINKHIYKWMNERDLLINSKKSINLSKILKRNSTNILFYKFQKKFIHTINKILNFYLKILYL